MKLSRKLLPDLHDVTIQCSNKQLVNAHKCVLITRMEYFRFMFTSSNWSEVCNSVSKKLYSPQLSIPQTKNVNWRTLSAEYVEPLVDFLYDNDVPALYARNYSDTFICNMLVICDQYFVADLCAVFERMLIERLSIKKAVDLYDFAGDYNRVTLRQACLEFMVANIERMLEHHCLVNASAELIGQVSETYCARLPEVGSKSRAGRLAKCFKMHDLDFDEAWDDVQMANTVKDFDLNLSEVAEVDVVPARRKKERKTSDSQQERIQMEKEAIEAMRVLSLEEDTTHRPRSASNSSSIVAEADKVANEILAQAKHWTKVTTDKREVRLKSVVAGLKANEVLAAEKREDDQFVSLNTLSYSNASFDSGNEETASNADEFFERSPLSLGSFSLLKPLKLSQKQRKSLNKIANQATAESDIRPGSPVQGSNNPWSLTATSPSPNKRSVNLQSSPSPSFFDSKPGSSNPMFDTPRSARSQPTSPCSNGSTSEAMPTSKSMDHFASIVRNEQREKNYFHKLRNKSLALTLLEERAIDELKKFYNIDNTFDERISVERIEALQPTMNFAKWDLEK